jgi:membrane protein
MNDMQHKQKTLLRAWIDMSIRVGKRMSRDNVSMLAAGVAFYVFVAIPAGLTAVMAVYGLVFNPNDVKRQLASMAGLLPNDVISLILSFLTTLTSNPRAELGTSLIVALPVALWSAQSATSSMIVALDVVYEEKETRSFVRFQLTAFLMAVGVIAFAVIALSLGGLLPVASGLLGLVGVGGVVTNIIRWPLLVFFVALAVAGIYRFAPDRGVPGGRESLGGVVLATVLCLLDSFLFSLYVAKFASYDRSYGSLGAVIVLLLWLYFTVFAVLVGAALNFEVEQNRRIPSA